MHMTAPKTMTVAEPRIALGFAGVTQDGFDKELARLSFEEAKAWLGTVGAAAGVGFVAGDSVFDNAGSLENFLAALLGKNISGLIMQTSTFASGELALAAADWAKRHRIPVVLWGVPETSEGGPLRANSFCACNFYASVFRAAGARYKWVYGPPGKDAVQAEFLATMIALKTLGIMRGAAVGHVGGSRVPGFYGSNYDEMALRDKFGLNINHVDLTALFDSAGRVSDRDVQEVLAEIDAGTQRAGDLNVEELTRSARLTVALRRIAAEGGYIGLAVKCWPDISLRYGASICASLAMLANDGIVIADESDIWGLATELCSYHLASASRPPTLMDAVGFDQERNQLHMWHCGATSWTLCRAGSAIRTCRHFNQAGCGSGNAAAVCELLLDYGPVTLARIMGLQGEHVLVAEGEVQDSPVAYQGAFGAVRLNIPVSEFISSVMNHGCEHHYALTYGHHATLWRELAYWRDIKLIDTDSAREMGPFGLVGN